MEKIENKAFDFEVKATDDEKMEFEGYGSIFGNLDSYRDIIEKGAFNRTIKNNKSRMKVLWQHDWWEPIGKPKEMYEDDKGLFLKAKISDTDVGRKAYTLMKDKVINELSIGYRVVKYEYDKDKDIRYLKEIKLFEVSPVTWAANDRAKINNVKSFDYVLDEIKNGNLLENVSKDKILNAIKSLQSLVNVADSEQSTQNINNSIKKISADSNDFINSVLEKLKKQDMTA